MIIDKENNIYEHDINVNNNAYSLYKPIKQKKLIEVFYVRKYIRGENLKNIEIEEDIIPENHDDAMIVVFDTITKFYTKKRFDTLFIKCK